MRYCFSTDEESFQGDFATREEAADAGRAYKGDDSDGEPFNIWTAESHRCSGDEFMPDGGTLAEHVTEHMALRAREVWEDAEYPDVTREQERALGERLEAVVRAWVEETCATTGIWRCEEVKAHEFKAVPS